MIERVEFEFRFELKDRERFHMEALHATLNTQVPNRTQAEYHQANAEHIKEQKSQKFDCPRGGKYPHTSRAKHFKTKRHRNYELGKEHA